MFCFWEIDFQGHYETLIKFKTPYYYSIRDDYKKNKSSHNGRE